MRVLVCGGRDFGRLPETPPPHEISPGVYCLADKNHPDYLFRKAEFDFIHKTLGGWFYDFNDDQWMPYPELVIIHGGATGTDTAADEWAVIHWVAIERYKADWKKYGSAAGPIRNTQMLIQGKPDVVVAFPGGKGTAHMVRIAKTLEVPVIEVKYEI